MLAYAVAAAVVQKGASRAFWAAFAVVGGMYLILALAPWCEDTTGELLLTRHVIDLIGKQMGRDVLSMGKLPGVWMNLPNPNSTGDHLAAVVAGHSCFAMMAGYLAGIIARRRLS